MDARILATAVGADRVAMADATIVRQATGQAIGGVAPVGHPAPLRTIIDRALLAYPTIWTAGGTPSTLMPLTPRQLHQLTDAVIAQVAADEL